MQGIADSARWRILVGEVKTWGQRDVKVKLALGTDGRSLVGMEVTLSNRQMRVDMALGVGADVTQKGTTL